MNYYILKYHTVATYLEDRMKYRQEHLNLAREAAEKGTLLLGGALEEPADEALLIFQGDSPDVARSFAEKDPYVKNGLIHKWEVRGWKVVVGSLEGRKEQ